MYLRVCEYSGETSDNGAGVTKFLNSHNSDDECQVCGEINPVTAECNWEKVTMTADTGAVTHVVRPDVAPQLSLNETEASRTGKGFTGAEGSKLPNLGEKHANGVTDEGLPINMTWQVAGKLKRNLAAIGRICSEGNRVVFDEEGSYIENKSTKAQIPMRKVGGLFEFDLWLPRAKDDHIKTQVKPSSNMFAVLNEKGEADIEDDLNTDSGFTRLVERM